MNIFQAVCVGLVYARQLWLRGKWKWPEIGLQHGAGEARSPSSSPAAASDREKKVLAGLGTAAQAHLPPPSAQMQCLFQSLGPPQAVRDAAELCIGLKLKALFNACC